MSDPTTTLLDPRVLFTNPPCVCCACCEDYCPDYETHGAEPNWAGPLFRVNIEGVEYVGPNWLLIRVDALQQERIDIDVLPIEPTYLVGTIAAPTKRPDDPTQPLTVRALDVLDRAGVVAAGGGDAAHLYVDERHVGWVRPAKTGHGTPAVDLPIARVLAREIGIDLRKAAAALAFIRKVEGPA
ncbi:hypothetical protein [Nocardioides alkalitolerans]|uniref:hypothetical protein n=1 Tax=Nocardioides alkalitolerans TaxID=281714 RepID=UPI00040BE8A3|nr:hypothetical protein [Nocardioides alkalitolerans]